MIQTVANMTLEAREMCDHSQRQGCGAELLVALSACQRGSRRGPASSACRESDVDEEGPLQHLCSICCSVCRVGWRGREVRGAVEETLADGGWQTRGAGA